MQTVEMNYFWLLVLVSYLVIISAIVFFCLLYKKNKKLSVKIYLVIKNYNAVAIAAATSLTNSYFPKKPEKKLRMVQP